MSVRVAATNVDRLVYLLVANRPFKWGNSYTRIAYIGTTEKGLSRIAYSAAKRIQQAVETRIVPGLAQPDAYVVWARPKPGPQTRHGTKYWHILERALLIAFCKEYGEPPVLNSTGQRMRERNEFDVFRRKTIDRIISRYT